jgi:hypothetical protein
MILLPKEDIIGSVDMKIAPFLQKRICIFFCREIFRDKPSSRKPAGVKTCGPST